MTRARRALVALEAIHAQLVKLEAEAREHVRHCRSDGSDDIPVHLEAAAQQVGWARRDERAYLDEHEGELVDA